MSDAWVFLQRTMVYNNTEWSSNWCLETLGKSPLSQWQHVDQFSLDLTIALPRLQFYGVSNPFIFKFGFTPRLERDKKRKKKKVPRVAHFMVFEPVNSQTLCPLAPFLAPFLSTLIRPAEARKMTYCHSFNGSREQLLTPRPNQFTPNNFCTHAVVKGIKIPQSSRASLEVHSFNNH